MITRAANMAPRAGQRQQPNPRVLNPGDDARQLTGSAEQARGWDRQIAGWLQVLDYTAGERVEPHAVLPAQPQGRGEAASGVAVDGHAEATLHIADRTGTDTRPVRELLLGHACRRAELLERDAQRLVGHRDSTR